MDRNGCGQDQIPRLQTNNESTFLIMKAIKTCIADCRHCATEKKTERMTVESAVQAFEMILKLTNIYRFNIPAEEKSPLNFVKLCWHGGEPMLMGKDFYYQVYDSLTKKYPGINISFSMQTNLLLYNSSWKDIFSDLFHKCISSSYDFFSSFRQLDGSVEKYRERFLDRVELYCSEMGKKLTIINVLSMENVDRIDEIFAEVVKYKLLLKLNKFYTVGNGVKIQELDITPKQYGDAMVRAFDLCMQHGYPMFEQGIEFLRYAYSKRNQGARGGGKTQLHCNAMNSCVGGIFGIEPDGTIWNCSEAADMNLNIFANYHTGTIYDKNIIKMKSAELLIPQECIDCGICESGCKIIKNRYFGENNYHKKAPYCEAWRALYNRANSLSDEEMRKIFEINAGVSI